MKKIKILFRFILGLIFTIFGLNGFMNFIPMPEMNEKAMQFILSLNETGYFFPVLKGTELICGLLLLANKHIPVVLTLLTPITINIFLFHFFIARESLPLASMILIIHICLIILYFKEVQSYTLFKTKKNS